MNKLLLVLFICSYHFGAYSQSKDTIPPGPFRDTVAVNEDGFKLSIAIPKFLNLVESRLKGECKEFAGQEKFNSDLMHIYKEYSKLDNDYISKKSCDDAENKSSFSKHHPKLECIFKDPDIQKTILEDIVRNKEFGSYLFITYSVKNEASVKDFFEKLISHININAN